MVVSSLIKKVFGSRNERYLKQLRTVVAQINAEEHRISALSDNDLAQQTEIFRARLATGSSLTELLPEAFAVVREVAKRTLNMRHFDVQLLGGIVLHEGKIAEMRTGEGKTLVSTLPAYLNALSGEGVHLITVNDYLAERDAAWMRPIYDFLGLSVGVIKSGMSRLDKQTAYSADITYGTNNEFGFDYLRDNMVFEAKERMQRRLAFAVIDEVDSILIDEARTPLIISGQTQDSSELYLKINHLMPQLSQQHAEDQKGDFTVDEKNKQVFFTETGHEKIEHLLVKSGLLQNTDDSLYAPHNINLMHYLYAGLKAHALFKRDIDYIVKDNQIIIVDEHTGRTMPGRRWSEGIHQAIEAKEGVRIESENQTLASITFQNYFRLYHKLAGMTGTADTEAFELQQIYNLEVIVIPTNKPSQRIDHPDVVYMSVEQKFEAIIDDILTCSQTQQPVLVGTVSIETSELLAKLLRQHRIKHRVLNAKYHQEEAKIIAEAGRPGAVTIATNMAGRGTDIVLGGNLEMELEENPADPAKIRADWQARHEAVLKAGGLYIIGTERHESRRIDNQLRGRAGRQGDPGETRFYLSIKDNLLRIFVSDNISTMLNKFNGQDTDPISHPWLNRAIENAQRKVEGHNFDIRKQLLEYDDIANEQRQVIYQQRHELLFSETISTTLSRLEADVIQDLVTEFVPPDSFKEQWDIKGLEQCLEAEFGHNLNLVHWLITEETSVTALFTKIQHAFQARLVEHQQRLSLPEYQRLEKALMLSIIDTHWKEHLALMEQLRHSIHLRGYAQKDPKQEYKRESFLMFARLLDNIKRDVVTSLQLLKIKGDFTEQDEQRLYQQATDLEFSHASLPEEGPQKVGRNALCPCGSGKKYKHCHGQIV